MRNFAVADITPKLTDEKGLEAVKGRESTAAIVARIGKTPWHLTMLGQHVFFPSGRELKLTLHTVENNLRIEHNEYSVFLPLYHGLEFHLIIPFL